MFRSGILAGYRIAAVTEVAGTHADQGMSVTLTPGPSNDGPDRVMKKIAIAATTAAAATVPPMTHLRLDDDGGATGCTGDESTAAGCAGDDGAAPPGSGPREAARALADAARR